MLGSLELLSSILGLLLGSLSVGLDLIIVGIKLVLLCSNLVELSGSSLKVRLQLLKISALFEQSLTGCSALVLQDLLALEVSTLSTLHEFVPVVLVSDLQMIQSVQEGLYLLFTLLDFTI